MVKRKQLYMLLPIILAALLAVGAVTKTYDPAAIASAMDKPYNPKYSKFELWLKAHEQLVMVGLALGLPLTGWFIALLLQDLESRKERHRQAFLAKATVAITDSVSERLVAKLELLEERIEWIYKEISDFESKLHITDNELNQMRLELTRLTTDVKVLRATRREFLHRLNEQLLDAEKRLNNVVRSHCGGTVYFEPRTPDIIVDPFEEKDGDDDDFSV